MVSSLYILTCLTTLLCAVLLMRAYVRVRRRLLLWSALCFIGLTISNCFVFADFMLLPQTDLYSYRLGSTAVALALLLYGLIWESQ